MRRLQKLFGSRSAPGPVQPTSGAAPSEPQQDITTSPDALEAGIRQLIDEGKLADALYLARQASREASGKPQFSYLYGLALDCVGRHEEALEAYQAELAVNPAHEPSKTRSEELAKALARPVLKQIPTHLRSWHSSLPRPTLLSIQQSLHNYCYRGVPMLKNPFDVALYTRLIWQLKPRTIFEIGSKSGGSALWMGDMIDSYGIDTHIYSVDVEMVRTVSHPRVTFMEGDGRALGGRLSPDFLEKLPRPWLVIEDADHAYETSIAVLRFFQPWLKPDEYIVVEDGIISDLVDDQDCNSGPHRALKEFLQQNPDEFEIDGEYCDFFGYNVTWCTNGFLKKTPKGRTPRAIPEGPLDEALQLHEAGLHSEALAALNQIKAGRVPLRNVDLTRARCFLAMEQSQAALEAAKEELRYFADNDEAGKLVARLEESIPASLDVGNEEFQQLAGAIRRYTMVGPLRLLSLYTLARRVCEEDIPGNFVECGVAGGGSSALLASVFQRHGKGGRRLYACDTFTGMPDASSFDTHMDMVANDTGWGAGTCAAPVDSLLAITRELGVESLVEPVKGLFSDTLPKLRGQVGPIAFLHMDGDWYSSTCDILENLFDQVVDGGLIQIDDYGFWDGCRRAIEEFQEKRGIRFDLHEIDGTGVWLVKNGPRAAAAPGARQLLNLGCGGHFHPDWVNVDIAPHDPRVMRHDLQSRLPFGDSGFDAVYHSHVLEHIPRNRAEEFLTECHRVLLPGGTLRVVVPDLETIARLYLKYLDGAVEGDDVAARRHEWMTLELLDQLVREEGGGEVLKYWRQNPMPAEDFVIGRMGREVLNFLGPYRASLPDGGPQPAVAEPPDMERIARFRQSGEVHKWMYDRHSLRMLLEKCGFRDVRVCGADESRIPGFAAYGLDTIDDGSTRKPDSLFVEAVKA